MSKSKKAKEEAAAVEEVVETEATPIERVNAEHDEDFEGSHYARYTESHQKYQNSEKGKAARKRYQDSPKGKEARKKSQQKAAVRRKAAMKLLKEEEEANS